MLPDGSKQKHFLPTDASDDFQLSIGRMPDCDVVVPLPSVSGLHARIVKQSLGYVLRDEDSTNGLVVNGEKEFSVLLEPGKLVLMGEAVLSYDPNGGGIPDAVASVPVEAVPVEQITPMAPIVPVASVSTPESFESVGVPEGVAERIVLPEARELIDENPEEEEHEEDVRPKRVVAKSYYLTILCYLIVVFGVAFAAGLIYKHYAVTKELLPYKWLGEDSPKEEFYKHIEEKKNSVRIVEVE